MGWFSRIALLILVCNVTAIVLPAVADSAAHQSSIEVPLNDCDENDCKDEQCPSHHCRVGQCSPAMISSVSFQFPNFVTVRQAQGNFSYQSISRSGPDKPPRL